MNAKSTLTAGLIAGAALVLSTSAFAIPALQLGPGDGGDDSWYYGDPPDCETPATWCASSGDDTLQLGAYANDTLANGGAGDYPWDGAGATNQYAYLVVSAMPKQADATDVFDVSVSDDVGALTMVASGHGAAPVSDTSDLAKHGVFDTYFEIFEFQFDDSALEICNTQPGNESDCGQGFKELLNVTLNSFAEGITGIHFDLFTIQGGTWDTATALVNAFAPFTHDAEWGGGDGGDGGGPNCEPPFCVEVPEPGMTALMGTGLVALGFIGWRRRRVGGVPLG